MPANHRQCPGESMEGVFCMSFISIAKEEKQKEKNGRMKFKYIFVLYKKYT